MNITEYERIMRSEFTRLFESNKAIETIFKKMRTSVIDYGEAQTFATELGDILQRVFKDTLPGSGVDIQELADTIVRNAANQNISLTNLVCETAQETLNKAAGINLAPKAPKAPTEQINGIVELVSGSKSEEAAVNALGKIKTLTMQNVDSWVKTNADFQKDAGLEPIVVRKWDGTRGSHDTKHTDWCSRIQGTYKYGEQPENFFVRHEGCQCEVKYYPNNNAKGRITALAKGEKDVDGVLWNTGSITSYTPRAQKERRKRERAKANALKIIEKAWK